MSQCYWTFSFLAYTSLKQITLCFGLALMAREKVALDFVEDNQEKERCGGEELFSLAIGQ